MVVVPAVRLVDVPVATVLEALKAERPDVLVALGGAHIDSTKEDTFAMADCFDLAVHGEGEYTLLEICQNIQQYGTEDLDRCLAEIPNAIYRSSEMGEVVVNPPRTPTDPNLSRRAQVIDPGSCPNPG